MGYRVAEGQALSPELSGLPLPVTPGLCGRESGWVYGSLKGWPAGLTSSISLCREPPARTPYSGLQSRHPAARPVVWKLHQALQPQRSASLAPAMGQPLRNGPRRHLGPRRPQAQLLRVGCVLGTCQVQNLSHRLWQLIGSAGPHDSAPVDPSSPHSYG